MLLVDDDKSEIFNGREDRGASAYDEVCLTVSDPCKRVISLPCRKSRMDEGDPVAVARVEDLKRLRCQRDLGKEHNNALALRKRFVDRADDNAGLSASRDPVEQYCSRFVFIKLGFYYIQRLGLLGVELIFDLFFYL